jgi:hypothetical protein
MDTQFQAVHTNYVAQLWPQVEAFMLAAQKECGGDYTLDQIKMYLTLGTWSLFVFTNDAGLCGAMAVSFVNYPNDRVAFIPAVGGKDVLNQKNWDQVRSMFKNMGITKIQAGCRQSMVRLLERLGFSQRCVVVEDLL